MKNTIIQGDALQVLKTLKSESIDCVVTSPPYWGLRNYGVDGQIGLETNFQEYLDKLWKIFDEVYRILKLTGTCWVNLGDTYFTGINNNDRKKVDGAKKGIEPIKCKLPNKCLVQIPSRFAIGMVERGWILRNEIIWHKPNAMPSSVKDRFTIDFEKIFFFVKQEKYYFKQQFEPFSDTTFKRIKYAYNQCKGDIQGAVKSKGSQKFAENVNNGNLKGKNKRTTWFINTASFKGSHFAVFPKDIPEICIKAGCPKNGIVLDPFMGSGTTAVVAKMLGRNYLGIELNSKYIEMANKRIYEVLV